MEIEFDPAKRKWTLKHRSLDFEDDKEVLRGLQFTAQDLRRDYGEPRHITVGMLSGRMMVVVWTPRVRNGETIHRILSMRKANDREKARFQNQFRQA